MCDWFSLNAMNYRMSNIHRENNLMMGNHNVTILKYQTLTELKGYNVRQPTLAFIDDES
jgi:hypothetical protein